MTTPKLQMPELVVGQAGKELTHNQALAVLDQLAQAVVVDKDLTAPPGSPANGSMYIVAAGATGDWAGQAGKLAYWLSTVAAWTFITPADGWSVWVADEAIPYDRKAGAWVDGEAVRTTGAQSVAGIKTFTSRVQIQNVAPGFWLDETDGVAGVYVTLDGGVLQFQRRASNFGAFEGSVFSLNVAAPAGSLALAADGTFTVAGPALRPVVDSATTCGTAAVKWSALYTLAASFYGAALVVADTGSLGYGTGSGGTVTQATSKATGVTLNKPSGQITTNSAALAANTSVSFTLTNDKIAANDTLRVVIKSGATAGAYIVQVDAVAAGSCRISIRNMTAGSLSETLVLQFSINKGAIA